MTVDIQDTARLLTFIAGVDQRMAVSERDAQIRAQAWQHMLKDVDAGEAAAFAKRYYQQAPQWSIQAGDIYQGCKPNPRWEDRTEHQQLAGRAVPMPDDVKRLLNLDTPDHRARKVSCSWCKAGPGQNCTAEGKPLKGGRVHPSRLDAAA